MQMTNDEIRMTKEARMTNGENVAPVLPVVGSFGLRHSSLRDTRTHSQWSVELGTRNSERGPRNLERSARNTQHATRNTKHEFDLCA